MDIDGSVYIGGSEYRVNKDAMISISERFREHADKVEKMILNTSLQWKLKPKNGPASDAKPADPDEIEHTSMLQQFFDICRGQRVSISKADIVELLATASEWRAVSVFRTWFNDMDVGFLAQNFHLLAKMELLALMDYARVCEVKNHKECRMPSKSDYAKFVSQMMQKHGQLSLPLLNDVDLLWAELPTLYEIQDMLKQFHMETLCPDLAKIVDLKTKEQQYDKLMGKEK